jgi:hypothetical protein
MTVTASNPISVRRERVQAVADILRPNGGDARSWLSQPQSRTAISDVSVTVIAVRGGWSGAPESRIRASRNVARDGPPHGKRTDGGSLTMCILCHSRDSRRAERNRYFDSEQALT